MGRYAKSGVTVSDLEQKIKDAGGIYTVVDSKRIQDDPRKLTAAGKTSLSRMNAKASLTSGWSGGYDTLPNGVAVCWIQGGGDWELPLAFCIYIGDDGALRAYIPKDGNMYNFSTKAAIGNWHPDDEEEEEEDEYEEDNDEIYGYEGEIKHFGLPKKFDMKKLRSDAANRITFKRLG